MALWTVRTSFLKSLSTLTKIATKHIYYVRATKYEVNKINPVYLTIVAVTRNECLMLVCK